MKPPEGMASEACCISVFTLSQFKANYLAGMVASSWCMSLKLFLMLFLRRTSWRESSLFQQFTQQSREEGFEQGIEQGGRQRAIEDILEVLEIRFDLDESDPLSTRIATIEDLQRLKQLLRAAVQVSNLDDFERMLDS